MNVADIERLISDPTPVTSSEISAIVAAKFESGALAASERETAADILRLLIRHGTIGVREALSAQLKSCRDLPHDVALALASDVENVALPTLKNSEVLDDDDLMAIIAQGRSVKQIAIAQRHNLAPRVADALIESGNEKAVAMLVANETAELTARTITWIVDSYGHHEAVIKPLMRRLHLQPHESDRITARASSQVTRHGGHAGSGHIMRSQYSADASVSDPIPADVPGSNATRQSVIQARRIFPWRINLPKSDAPTAALHWALVFTLLVSLATGFRIAADAEDAVWSRALADVLPQGDVIRWHLWGALSLLSIAVAYVFFLVRARLTQRVAFNRPRLRSLLEANGKDRWQAINVLLYWIAFACIFMSGLTGILLYLIPHLLPYVSVSVVHQAFAWSIVAYAVIHVAAQAWMGGLRQLLKILNPQRAYGTAAALSFIAAAGAAVVFYGLEQGAIRSLEVARINTAPVIDGYRDDEVWQRANDVTIHTARGQNLPGGEVSVSVRALHDAEYFYGYFEWPDATRSLKHLPLMKTQNGWTVMQQQFGIQDEDDYYEDSLAVMLAYSVQLTAHLGDQPLEGKPGPAGGRGLHYTLDGSIVDVWHWKSVRSGSEFMNQIDDNYFGPPLEPNPKKSRYTGGHTKDPETGGGFKMNWEAYRDGLVRPLRLPKDPNYLNRFSNVDHNPDVGDGASLYMPLHETVPYSEALDQYAVGTIMPSVLLEGPFQGDRGDVDAVAHWRDGVWRMEVRRKLDTGSKYDVALTLGQPVYMWVAVFDHTQTRHSQHLHPIKLVLV